MKTALMQIWWSSIGGKFKIPLIIFNWSVRAASHREATLLVYFLLVRVRWKLTLNYE